MGTAWGTASYHLPPLASRCGVFLRRQLLFFPRGNNKNEAVSLYLMAADLEEQPLGWCRAAHFKLTMVNHKDPAGSITKGALCCGCWGWAWARLGRCDGVGG